MFCSNKNRELNTIMQLQSCHKRTHYKQNYVQVLFTIYYTKQLNIYHLLIRPASTYGRKRTNDEHSRISLIHFAEDTIQCGTAFTLKLCPLAARRIVQRVNSEVQNYDGFIALEQEQDRAQRKKGTKAIRTLFLIICVLVIERLIVPRAERALYFIIYFSINGAQVIAK